MTRDQQRLQRGFEAKLLVITLTSKDDPLIREPLTLRVITYRLRPQAASLLEQVTASHSQHASDTTNPKVHEIHCLVTTLLDPVQAPALDLIDLYHESLSLPTTLECCLRGRRVKEEPHGS